MNNNPTKKLNRLKSTMLCLVFGVVTAGPVAVGMAAPKESTAASLLGRHTINLQLNPLPAAKVLETLSARSKAVARMDDLPADEGRAWQVEGAELLEGQFVKVSFTETPVEEVVDQVLGCVGFGYKVLDDRIHITRIANPRSGAECESVEIVSSPTASGAASTITEPKYFSWQVESISALDFVRRWSNETGQNIMVLQSTVEDLRKIALRVSISNVRDEQALSEMAKCIGWTYERIGVTFNLHKPEKPNPSKCDGFTVLS